MDKKKHLFNSTEKSDFIVNMTYKQFSLIGFWLLAISTIGIFISSIPYYIAKGGQEFSYMHMVNDDDIVIKEMYGLSIEYLSTKSYLKCISVFLLVAGFIGYLMLVIAASKKYFSAKKNKSMLLLCGYLLFCVISSLFAYDIQIALIGRNTRFEGLIAIFSYVGIFVAASQLSDKPKHKTILDVFLSIAAINAILGVLQCIPSTSNHIPTYFRESLKIFGSPKNSYDYYIADGFTTSPYALAAMMTMALAVAGCGLLYEKSKVRKLIYALGSILFMTAGLLTCTTTAIIGMGVVILTILVVEIVRLAKGHALVKGNLFSNPIGLSILLIILGGAVLTVFMLIDRLSLLDSTIILNDSQNRTGTGNPKISSEGFAIFPKIWEQCWDYIKGNWLLGTGMDCIGCKFHDLSDISETQTVGVFSIDRAYNEYFNIALSCGLPALIFYLGFIASSVIKGIKGIGRFFVKEDSWTTTAAAIAVFAYVIQANFNISTITVTPMFFLLIGLLWAIKPAKASEK